MLLCDAGGILTPIFSYSVARKNAALIKSNNNKEIFVNAAASFFGGAGAVISVAEVPSPPISEKQLYRVWVE